VLALEHLPIHHKDPFDPLIISQANRVHPLVRAWWDGTGFVGRCPACGGWLRFTTLGKEAFTDEQAARYPKLPDHRHTVAQFA